jgi:hypothetical protein
MVADDGPASADGWERDSKEFLEVRREGTRQTPTGNLL